MAASLGNAPATSQRRFTSRWSRSSGLVTGMKGIGVFCSHVRGSSGMGDASGQYGATVRDGASGETLAGQVGLFDQLGARVSYLPRK
jgi:hypothetical protein